MKKIIFALAAIMALAACGNKQAATPTSEGNVERSEVPFEVAKNYFFKNNQMIPEYPKIVSEEEFNKLFGMATKMGEDGKPTAIDFTKQFVLAIVLPETDFATEINPVKVEEKGDTLKCVSGGSHPGLLHIRQTEKGFEVTAFDQVEDGSRYLPTAKKVFGDKYDAFQAINSDEKNRERLRAEGLATYAKKNGLAVTLYQDYGWPAKKLEK